MRDAGSVIWLTSQERWHFRCHVRGCTWKGSSETSAEAVDRVHRHLVMAHVGDPVDLRQEPEQV
jgi:hypothetical protein